MLGILRAYEKMALLLRLHAFNKWKNITTDPETAFKASSAARVPAVKKNIHSYADILRLYAMAMFFESSEYLESFL